MTVLSRGANLFAYRSSSEGERVRMLLSLAAYAGGYRMMVGAHNTVECQMHVGGGVVFFGYGRRWRLPHVDT